MTHARHHVNLCINAGKKSHYVFVKDLSRLVLRQYNNDNNKRYSCQYRLHGCTSEEVLKNHMERCKESSSQKLAIRRGMTKSSLQKHNNYVYLLLFTWISNPSPPNTNIVYHVGSFCIYVKCNDAQYLEPPHVNMGGDDAEKVLGPGPSHSNHLQATSG